MLLVRKALALGLVGWTVLVVARGRSCRMVAEFDDPLCVSRGSIGMAVVVGLVAIVAAAAVWFGWWDQWSFGQSATEGTGEPGEREGAATGLDERWAAKIVARVRLFGSAFVFLGVVALVVVVAADRFEGFGRLQRLGAAISGVAVASGVVLVIWARPVARRLPAIGSWLVARTRHARMLAVGVVILAVGVAGFSYVRGPVHVGGGSIHGAWSLDEIKDADLAEWTNPYGDQWPTGHPRVIFTVEPDVSLFIDPRRLPSGDPWEYRAQIGCSFDGFYRVVGDRIESYPAPATLALRLCPFPYLDRTFRTARWAANDTTLILTTDADVTAVFEALPQTDLVGVWRLHELEGRETEAEATLTFHPGSRVSGYVGCSEWGIYRVEGDSITLADWGQRFTTAFLPALSCELQTPDEALFSSLLRSASIWDFNGDELTIGTAEGLTAVLRRA